MLEDAAARLSDRDRSYLDRYYDAVNRLAQQYKVDPALVLGMGIESAFATKGTYQKTGDAFGMTGGHNDSHMTTATSPEQNAQKFFQNFGKRLYGVGGNTDAFINALQGHDAAGRKVPGWLPYNSDNSVAWGTL